MKDIDFGKYIETVKSSIVREDEEYGVLYGYDENGNKIYSKEQKPRFLQEIYRMYYDKGSEKSMLYVHDGKPSSYTEINESGKVTYYRNGNDETIYEFDENGNKTLSIRDDGIMKLVEKWKYDDKGHEILHTSKNSHTKGMGITRTEYDDDGKLTYYVDKHIGSDDGDIIYKELWMDYNDDGKIIYVKEITTEGEVAETINEYEDGELKSSTAKLNGIIINEETYENINGERVMKTKHTLDIGHKEEWIEYNDKKEVIYKAVKTKYFGDFKHFYDILERDIPLEVVIDKR